MIGQTATFAIGSLLIALTGSLAFSGEVFLSPRLETQAGYENNRYVEVGNGVGSPFLQASPGLDVTAFGMESETSLLLDYRLTQYTQSGFESKDLVTAFARHRYFVGLNDLNTGFGAGRYRDRALPEDDTSFWWGKTCFVRSIQSLPVELSVEGNFHRTFYNSSVYTSVTARADNLADVRPGFRWHISRRATAWSELYVERNVSGAPEAGYSGFGGALGYELRPLARMVLGAWAEAGTRPYEAEVADGQRRDTPCHAGAWIAYRLRPWAELFSAAEWDSIESTIDSLEYSWWQARAGIRLVSEHELRR